MGNCSICNAVNRWLKQPFQTQGSVWNWIGFVGLIMVAVVLWSRVLVRIAP